MNSKLRFLLISLFIFFVAALQASADGDIRVSGVVMSEGEPLPGASVLVKGTHNGTVTDVDGKYTLTVPADGTLVFSFIGLKTTEQKVNGRTVVNAELLPDSEQLDEVMVVAYATAKKYSFTGAASTVKGSEIAKIRWPMCRVRSKVRFPDFRQVHPAASRVRMLKYVFAVSALSMRRAPRFMWWTASLSTVVSTPLIRKI